MGTRALKRPARIAPPEVDAEPIVIAEPPKPQANPSAVGSAPMLVLPMIGGAGSLLASITNPNRPLFAAAGLVFLVVSVAVGGAMLYAMRSGPRRMLRERRERYLDYVEELRQRLRSTSAAQKADGRWRHPEPGQLLDVARMATRRWERRVEDPDFLLLRAGSGDQPIRTELTMAADDGPLNEFDPVCLEAARQLRVRYRTLRDQPACIALAGIGVLSVVGHRERGRALAKALLSQLVTLHAPQEVGLALVRSENHAKEWNWVKWVPHVLHPTAMDGDVPARRITTTVPAMVELLESELETRLAAYQRRRGGPAPLGDHLVVVVDGEHLTGVWGLEPAERGVSLADLGLHVIVLVGHRREEPETVDVRIDIDDPGFTVDVVPDGLLDSLARICAPLRVETEPDSNAVMSTIGLADVLGVPDVAHLDPDQTWRPRPHREFLRVPIGVGGTGNAVMLDFKESAHGGMGPHGLIVGATGSGKSELLRTLVMSLVISHPPERLALMLVDFKGGATFAPLAGLPHIAGMVTNIEDDLTLVDRMAEALFGEMRRRQELLRDAGRILNITVYQELIDQGQPLEPLPHLLVIIDEFSELLTAKPDFADLFAAIGRIGRSIGVNLLLATQRLEMGRIRGLDSNLSYRIGLRTFSETESREALGVPDAYHLPPEPGAGYLKVDTTVFERFKAALVSAPYTPPAATPHRVVPVVPYLAVNGFGEWTAPQPAPAPATVASSQATVLDVAVERLIGAGRAHVGPVWLEPLPAALPLDAVQDPGAAAAAGTLSAVIGLVDDPAHQSQFPMEWDFTGAGGNVLVVGAPQSGKSTLLRTMLCSVALRYPPGDVAIYCIDYGGGTLAPLQDLPHVAGVATRSEPEKIRRTIAEIAMALDERESAPAKTALMLVIDGWGTFREDHELLEPAVADIAARGLNYGVHVVLTLTQTMQVRMRMQPAFGGRIELRLNDTFDSGINRRLQERIDKESPGRGITSSELFFQTALPRTDAIPSLIDLPAAQKRLVASVADRWPNRAIPTVRVLPVVYPRRELPPTPPPGGGVFVGLAERDLLPAAVDLTGADPHLLVYGDGRTGKTNLLRTLLDGHVARYSSSELVVVVVDYRRSLLGVVPDEYQIAYCTTAAKTRAVAVDVAAAVARRLPGNEVTPEQLRSRTWWTGPEVLVVIDDYDLVATSGGNPLSPLLEYLSQGTDLGLHLVLARRTGGLSRALFEPVIQRLNDLSTPGFLFSGDRMEGRLVNGVASQRLPVGRALYAVRGGAAQQVQIAH